MADRLSTQILAVILFRLVLNTGRRFMYPFAPALSRGLDVPLTAITSIIAASQFTSLVGLCSGPLADRFGYRSMMRAGLAMLAFGMLLCGLAGSYWPVFVGLVIAAFGKTVFDPAIQAFIGRHVPYGKRGRVIGLVETSWAASTLIGIPALGLIIARTGMIGAYCTLAVSGALGWLLIGRVLPADPPPAANAHEQTFAMFKAIPRLFRLRAALGMLAFGFWISIANDCLFVIYGAWFEQDFRVSIAALGFSTVAIGAAELLGESLTSLFADRIGLKRAIILGLTLVFLAYLLLPYIGRTLPLAMAGMFLVFFANEFTIVSSFSIGTELMPETRATMMAGFYAVAGLGRMGGVLLGGLLWHFGDISTVSAAAALFTGLALLSLLYGLHGWQPAGGNAANRSKRDSRPPDQAA